MVPTLQKEKGVRGVLSFSCKLHSFFCLMQYCVWKKRRLRTFFCCKSRTKYATYLHHLVKKAVDTEVEVKRQGQMLNFEESGMSLLQMSQLFPVTSTSLRLVV